MLNKSDRYNLLCKSKNIYVLPAAYSSKFLQLALMNGMAPLIRGASFLYTKKTPIKSGFFYLLLIKRVIWQNLPSLKRKLYLTFITKSPNNET